MSRIGLGAMTMVGTYTSGGGLDGTKQRERYLDSSDQAIGELS